MGHHLPDPKGFRKRLRQAREERDISQRALGGFPGCSRVYVSLIEREDGREPSLQVIGGLAERLGVTANWLICGKDREIDEAARDLVCQIYEGEAPTLAEIDRIDFLSMPPWYRDWVEWVESGEEGERPRRVPKKIPKWVRDHYQARQHAHARFAALNGKL